MTGYSYPTKRLGVKNLRNKKQQGFTLIELLVVIAIIGLLASVVLLALNSARAKSRDAKRVADVRQIQSGLELFFNDCSSYPVEATAVVLGGTGGLRLFSGTGTSCGDKSGSSAVNGGIGDTAGGTTYIAQMPSAPAPNDGTCTATGAGSNEYRYTGTASTYTLTFCLGAVTGGLAAGTRTATEGGIQ